MAVKRELKHIVVPYLMKSLMLLITMTFRVRWDNHRFPKPFSTIHIGIGNPIAIDRVMFKDDPERAVKLLRDAMMHNVNKLKHLAYESGSF